MSASYPRSALKNQKQVLSRCARDAPYRARVAKRLGVPRRAVDVRRVCERIARVLSLSLPKITSMPNTVVGLDFMAVLNTRAGSAVVLMGEHHGHVPDDRFLPADNRAGETNAVDFTDVMARALARRKARASLYLEIKFPIAKDYTPQAQAGSEAKRGGDADGGDQSVDEDEEEEELGLFRNRFGDCLLFHRTPRCARLYGEHFRVHSADIRSFGKRGRDFELDSIFGNYMRMFDEAQDATRSLYAALYRAGFAQNPAHTLRVQEIPNSAAAAAVEGAVYRLGELDFVKQLFDTPDSDARLLRVMLDSDDAVSDASRIIPDDIGVLVNSELMVPSEEGPTVTLAYRELRRLPATLRARVVDAAMTIYAEETSKAVGFAASDSEGRVPDKARADALIKRHVVQGINAAGTLPADYGMLVDLERSFKLLFDIFLIMGAVFTDTYTFARMLRQSLLGTDADAAVFYMAGVKHCEHQLRFFELVLQDQPVFLHTLEEGGSKRIGVPSYALRALMRKTRDRDQD